MTSAPDPKVAELVERMARMIDPSSWRVMDSYLAETKRKYQGQDAAYDPDTFKHKESMAKATEILTALERASPKPMECYDAGLLSDFGGGNVEWWWDYIRSELASAHDFYADQATSPRKATVQAADFGNLAFAAFEKMTGVTLDAMEGTTQQFYINFAVEVATALERLGVESDLPEPNPEWEAEYDAAHEAIVAEVGVDPEATLSMLRQWKSHACPVNEHGQASVARSMLDGATDALALTLAALAQPTETDDARTAMEPFDTSRRDGDSLVQVAWEVQNLATFGGAPDLSERDAMAALAERALYLHERLQAIIDWADLALSLPQQFDSHGVRNLDGPVFDKARAFLDALEGKPKTLTQETDNGR